MKIIFIFGVFLFEMFYPIQAANSEISFDSRFSQNAIVHQLFEMFRGLIKHGDVEKNIPKMDPYKFNAENVLIQTINGNINITNGTIKGFSQFRLEEFEFSQHEITLDIIIYIPEIEFDLEYYEIEGELFQTLPVAGTGFLRFNAKNVTLNSKLYLKQSDSGKSILIDKLGVSGFTIDKILSHTEYANNIDGVLNAMIEDLLAGYLTRFSKFIAKTYEKSLIGALNPMLNNYDTWTILAILLNK